MIKWLLTTIILVLTVAIVTVIVEIPSLRAKAEKTLKARTALISSRVRELRGLSGSGWGESKQTSAAERAKSGTTSRESPAPEPQASTGAKSRDPISDSDRKQLEEVLEKAGRK